MYKLIFTEDGYVYDADDCYNLYKENKQLRERIDKSIEYINKNSKNELIEEIKHFAFYKKKIKYVDISELLEILKGGNNENR